jgi:predicted DNA-binding transcriptional regulator YafY
MAKDKPRLVRLASILTQLQSKRVLTAKDIANRHNISIRTVYRDIRTLEQSGIPIISEEGKGYSIMEGYQLPPVMFTEEEAMALITAEQLIRKNKDQSLIETYGNAITKIKSILKYNQKTKTEFLTSRLQIRNNAKEEKTSQYLMQTQKAIANFQIAELDYFSLNNQRSQRKIEPFALYTTKGNWILIAFCQNKKDFRAFRLDRIQKLIITSHHFEPHKITLEQYFEECRKKWMNAYDIPLSPTEFTFAENQKNDIMQKVKIEAFQLIGISVRTSNQNGQAGMDISKLWQQFMAENSLAKIPNKINDTLYALYTDYEGDHTQPYSVIVGCKVTHLAEIPAGMIGKSFEGGDYVKLTAKGDIMQGFVAQQWAKIWEMNLDRSFTADFEVYDEKSQNLNDAVVDFLIAIK